MGRNIGKIVAKMRTNPSGIRFADAIAVAQHYFGDFRQRGSHHVFPTPFITPRVNLQNANGKAKEYQVEQLLDAIDKLAELAAETDQEETGNEA